MDRQPYRRFVLSPAGNSNLPLIVESIGFNPNQETINRPNGYPYYHWIGTADGEGELIYAGEKYTLSIGNGILLPPNVPHSYKALTNQTWKTYYLTFGGDAAGSILSGFRIKDAAYFFWEPHSPVIPLISKMLRSLEQDDLFGLEISTDTYRFLGLLSKYGQMSNVSVTQNTERLTPLIQWMENHYSNPDIGLLDLSEVLGISSRQLSKIFLNTFGISPYAYLLQLRINRAKERLASHSEETVSTIANKTGFRDTSHFVATFRKHTHMTPQQFRKLH